MNESGYFSTASGSFHTTSRPPSRAWSESTERPGSSHSTLLGGPRSLTQEIEHIKKLITRAESNRQSSAGSITAVVFRTRKQEPVGREHIFHELDALKRRIKHEQQLAAERAKEDAHVLERRASQIDPGQESESETESVLDERDEELERANEALEVQRERFESLLESAEERVDLLTGQKEGLLLEKQHLEELLASEKRRLEVQLNGERQRSQIEKHSLEQELQREKQSRESVLCSAEERLDRLTEEKEIAKARTNHLIEERDELKRELQKLAAETGKLEADVVREKERLKGELGDTKAQLTRATKEKTSLENELQATRTWVEELNAKIEDGASALQEKSKAFDDLRTEKRSTDVAHRSTQEEILRLHALKSEVETALKDTSAKVAKLEKENRDAAEYLQNVLASNAASEKALRDHCDSLVAKTRVQEKANHDLQQRLAAVEADHDAAAKRAVELSRTYEKVIDELKSTHAGELDRVRAEEASKLKEIQGQHLYEKAELQASHVEEVQRVRDKEAEKTAEVKRQQEADAENFKSSHQAELSNFGLQHAEALEILKAAHAGEAGQAKIDAAAELDSIKQELAKERNEHAKELETIKDAGRDQLAVKTAELDHANSVLAELNSERDALCEQVTSAKQTALRTDEQVEELKATHAKEVERLTSAVHDVEAKLEKSRDDLEKHQAASSAKETALASELSAKSAQVTDYEVKLAELRLASATSAAELEQKVAALSHTSAVSKKALQDAERSHASALVKLSSDHDAQLAELRKEHAKEVKQAEATSGKQHEQAIQDLKEQHEKTLRDAIEVHQKQQNELEAVHAATLDRVRSDAQGVDDKLIQELEGRHAEALQREKQESDRVAAALKASHSEELELRDREHQAAVDESVRAVKASHQFLLDQRSRNAALNLEQARSDHVAEVSSLQAQLHEVLAGHEQTIAKTRQEHEAEVRRVTLAHEGESTASRTAGEQKMEEISKGYESRLAALQQDNEKALQDLQDAHAQASQAAEQRFQILQKSHRDAMENAKGQSTALEQGRTNMLQQHETQINNLQATHKAALGAIQARYAEKTTELERSYQSRTEAEQEKQRLVDVDLVAAHALEMRKLRDEHVAERVALSAELDLARQDAVKSQAEHESVVAELRKEHASYNEKVLDEHKAELASAEERALQTSSELEATTSRHVQEVAQLRAEHGTALEKERSAQAAAIELAKKQHDEELTRARRAASALESDMTNLANDHSKTIAKLRAEHETAIEKSTLEHARVHEKLAAEHDQENRRLQSKHDAEMSKVQQEMEKFNLDSAAAAAAHDTKIATMRLEHAEHVGAVEAEVGKALRKEHSAALELLKAEHKEQIVKLRESGNKTDHDRELEHQAEIVNMRGLGKAESEKLRNEHSIAIAAAEFAQRESVYQMQSDHDQQLKILAEQHQKRLDDLRVTMTQRQAKREEAFEESKKAAADELGRLRREHEEALEVARSDGGSTLEAKLAEAAAKNQEEVAALKIEHEKSLAEARRQMEDLQRIHQQKLAGVKLSLEGELDAARRLHVASVEDLQFRLEEAQSNHSKALVDQDSTWLTKAKALTVEHAKSLTELSANSDATTASKLRDLEQSHAIAVTKAVEEAKREAEKKAADAERQHRSALEAAVQKAQSSNQAEVRNLKKRHQDAVAHIRDAAQTTSAYQLKELEDSHQQALSEERARAAETLKTKMMLVETEHKSQLADLEARLRVDNETQIASRKAAFDAEIAALQVRLDAAMTGQAEAERSLASLRQKTGSAERMIADAKAESEEQIAALVKEKDDLTSQLELVQASLRKLQRKHSSGSATPRASIAVREDLAELHSQLATLEGERSSMKQQLQKRQEEKDEVSRQNDFLVKELEMLLQQRAKPRDNARSFSDALVQTDSFPAEPKADMAAFTPIKAARRSTNAARPMTPLSPGVRQARADIEDAWKARSFEDYLDNARAELSELGSVISANEALFARKITEHVGELQRAKDELAADYSAKVEALARDKDTMERLITSEQHAKFVKDRKKLVAKYGADFEDVTDRSAVLTGLPVNTADALRNAEQKLVNDYNQRITKRKSQIALKHAEEFQTITQDYDRQVSVLLNTRSRLEGDLSVDPSKFEDEYGDISKKSARLVAERKSNIGAPRSARKSGSPYGSTRRDRAPRDEELPPQMPMPPVTPIAPSASLEIDRARTRTRQWTSSPRDEQSIPRSSSRPRDFFPGSRDSPEATSQPLRDRRGSNKHPPVPQHFLMRTKEAADFFSPSRVASGPSPEPELFPRTPRGRPRSRAGPGGESSEHEVQQAAFAKQRVVSLQEKSPSILRRIKDKVSLNGGGGGASSARPGSSSGGRPSSSSMGTGAAQPRVSLSSWKPSHRKRSKSRHLSSGTIYDPARYPLPPVVAAAATHDT